MKSKKRKKVIFFRPIEHEQRLGTTSKKAFDAPYMHVHLFNECVSHPLTN